MLNSSTYFRISVTKRCNLSCRFCHKEGNNANIKDELTPQEIQFACKIAYKCGFHKFKITGGEPTERDDLCKIISLLSEMCLPDLSMITNGTNLDLKAQGLWDAGLRRMNVTINTLDSERFRYFAHDNRIDVTSVIKGVETAKRVGFKNIKINFVFFDEYSRNDLESLMEFVKEKGLTLVVLPVIGGTNYYSLDNMYEIVRSYGIVSEEIISDNEGLMKRKLNLKSGASILLRLDELADRKPYDFCDRCKGRSQCREGIFPIRLSANGELIPCMADLNHRINIRTMLHRQDTDGIMDAFHKIRKWEKRF